MCESSPTIITVANSLCVQIFVSEIFVVVAFPRKLVPNENLCIYGIGLQNWMNIYFEYGVQYILHHQYICVYVIIPLRV